MKRGERIIKECVNCKAEFIVLPSRSAKIFCCYRCFAEFSKGKKHWWTPKTAFKNGHKPSDETRLKMSQNRKGKGGLKGKDSPNWKGGKYKRYIHKCWTKTYKNWRDKIFKRDEWTCDECGKVGGKLQAHHILSWAEFPKLRYITYNGITLCVDCHKYVHFTDRLNKRIIKEYEK